MKVIELSVLAKPLSTVRGRCGFGSGLSIEELLGLGHLLNPPGLVAPPPLPRAVQTLKGQLRTVPAVSPGKAKCPRSFPKQVVFRKRQKAAGKQNAALWEGSAAHGNQLLSLKTRICRAAAGSEPWQQHQELGIQCHCCHVCRSSAPEVVLASP